MRDAGAAREPAVWIVDVGALPLDASVQRWHANGLISDDELAQAVRYRHEGARLQYLAGRALVRHALATLAPQAPPTIDIVPDSAGKPAFAKATGMGHWHFNISHSGTLVACVLAGAPVGIDIEAVKPASDHLAIARTHFSADEANWVAARSDAVARRFIALWTIKEAYLKALGIGLTIPVAGIAASRTALRSGRVASSAAPQPTPWHCRLAKPAPGYWLALCYGDALARVHLQWATL